MSVHNIHTYTPSSYLASQVFREKDVPGSQVPMYKGLVGEVVHPDSNLTTEVEEQHRKIRRNGPGGEIEKAKGTINATDKKNM